MLCVADLDSRFAGKEHDWRKRRECNKAYAETFRRKLKDGAAALATEEFAFENGPAFPDSQFLFISRTRDR